MRAKPWLWALGALAAVLAIAIVVVLVDRDDDSSSTAASTTTTTSTGTTTGAAGTTTTPSATTSSTSSTRPSTTTTTAALPPVTDDPQSYAEFLFAAWQHDNQTAAADVASADAVGQMFAEPYAPSVTWTFQMCGPAAGSLYCSWSASTGTTLTMTVRTLTGGLPVQVVVVQREG